GRLGYELVQRKGLRRFEAHISSILASCILPWAEHVARCRPLLRSAFEVANRTGDHHTVVTSHTDLVVNLLVAGEPLADAHAEADLNVEICRGAGFSDYLDAAATQAAFIRNLRGLTRRFGSLDDERFDERRLEQHFASQPHVPTVEAWYFIRKLVA